MDQTEIIAIAKRFVELVKKDFPMKNAYLFGSYANGEASEERDIDIAIVLDKITGNYLDQNTALFKLRRNVDLRIEPILLEDGNDLSGFLSKIKSTGIKIYSA
ncbi:MAG: nucleotidyltransferase domain-containing protein [Candidatus Cloacimonetes bacterium]|nr:nucleotidyltransferase domain-containing protein [Candidatus Cloacimonadota bacterium]MCF7812870.1 nucleotidyltransferase domain-containing protein [Candidatus Cloacimonadota bacterium]MCF7867082.1 nucleotidyltransferase domain-containing protein [Candidatus Cloacimonadota bacterium]MCF7882598.1 nucleotidyltransferase domain-containing protein [Candidatus Cloacimonadota bacterium]